MPREVKKPSCESIRSSRRWSLTEGSWVVAELERSGLSAKQFAEVERALEGGLELDGPIRAVLLVENLGAFCDLPALDGWLVVHVAGWDTATVARLVSRLSHVPALHFGDLDPNGVRIFQHLRALRADLRWFVPAFWEEYIENTAMPATWPLDLHVRDAPELARRVMSSNIWLEQEPIVLDPRIAAALESMLSGA
jgi:hypothetical protein